MFDHQAACRDLEQLHQATFSIKGYFKAQVAELIYVGEYYPALDTIAAAYLSNNLRMPTNLFTIFDHLARVMDLENDPKFTAVAELLKFQGTAS